MELKLLLFSVLRIFKDDLCQFAASFLDVRPDKSSLRMRLLRLFSLKLTVTNGNGNIQFTIKTTLLSY